MIEAEKLVIENTVATQVLSGMIELLCNVIEARVPVIQVETSDAPNEPGKYKFTPETIEVEVYDVDISGGCEVYPPDIRYFTMIDGHEVEVGELKGQWSGPKESS